ncbi:MAG TPA: hypothetical protein VK118_00500 [Tetragenococcus sp.]|nr:hypothetical protein [Tetragenococcus sp.]
MSVKLLFYSNLAFICCSICYLLWWLSAFKPQGAIKGLYSGWLLIPTFLAGLLAVFLAVKALGQPQQVLFFSNKQLLITGGLFYLLTVFVTVYFFKRPLTTELILIVAWLTLMAVELNQLYAITGFSSQAVLFLAIFIFMGGLVSLICYLQYYHLGIWASYIAGMIPLLIVLLVAIVMNLLLYQLK